MTALVLTVAAVLALAGVLVWGMRRRADVLTRCPVCGRRL